MMTSKIKKLLVASAAMMAAHCTHKEVREPASAKTIITDAETQALADLMGEDSPLHTYRHPMRVQFHTDGDQKYLTETARKALHESLLKTLSGDTPEQGLAKAVAGNLKNAMVDNFVKTMRFYKIINIGLQVDLTFAPEPNSPRDFETEFGSNQLVRLNETGRLSTKWEAQEKATFTGTLYNNSVHIPVTPEGADYIGGVMTLYVKILDAQPKLGLPSFRKNGVKGFVRYRRFYRLNKDPQRTAVCDKFTLSSKVAGSGSPLFYTVDLYKNFNLANIIPTEETLEIFPGMLASNNEGRSELMPDTYERSGKSITTGTFTVAQKPDVTGEISFNLKKIVYDLKEGRLDARRSDADLVGFRSPSANPDSASEEQSSLFHARRVYMMKCESSMKKFLNLEKLVQGDVL